LNSGFGSGLAGYRVGPAGGVWPAWGSVAVGLAGDGGGTGASTGTGDCDAGSAGAAWAAGSAASVVASTVGAGRTGVVAGGDGAVGAASPSSGTGTASGTSPSCQPPDPSAGLDCSQAASGTIKTRATRTVRMTPSRKETPCRS